MQAFAQDAYGMDALGLRDVARPEPGDGEVLVRVRAAGVDPGVWHVAAGLPYFVRIMGFGLRRPKVPVRGTDVAGIVEAVGEGATRFRVGDEVFGTCNGSFAEYACGPEDELAPKPANLTFEQAAAITMSAITALQALRAAGEVGAGQHVLVIGAAGGVGTYAVQLAKSHGAEVTGVCSTTKVDLVRSLHADHVVDYTREDFADDDTRYDVILDLAGNRGLAHLRRALAPRGTLVIVGGEGGGRWTGGLDRQVRAALLSPFVGQKLRSLFAKPSRDDLQTLRELVEAGTLTPIVDRTFPLAEVADAVRYVQDGHARGKVVLTV